MLDKSSNFERNELLTVGYEGSDIETFISRLLSEGVEKIVDVRELPLSRKRGFSKNRLREAAAEVGIEYVHLKSLGDPKEGRLAARAGKYDLFRQVFNEHMKTDEAQEGLRLLGQIVDEHRACLMCFERNHEGCHRHIVVDQLLAMKEIDVRHI